MALLSPTAGLEQAVAHLRGNVLCALLLQHELDRTSLGKRLGVSKAAMTHHIRWLFDQNLLESQIVRKVHSKRPVEMLRVDGNAGTVLALVLERDRIEAEVAALDGELLYSFQVELLARKQSQVIAAFAECFRLASMWTRGRGRQVDMCGLSLRGVVNPWAGMVHAVEGIDDWDSCQPTLIVEVMRESEGINRQIMLCPQATARLRGLAQQLERDHAVAYLQRRHGRFRVASLVRGRVAHGQTGAGPQWAHRAVSDNDEICFCGRHGCLIQALEHGPDQPGQWAGHLLNFVQETLCADDVALDWDGDAAPIARRLQRGGCRVHDAADAAAWGRLGTRMLTAQSLTRLTVSKRMLLASNNRPDVDMLFGEIVPVWTH